MGSDNKSDSILSRRQQQRKFNQQGSSSNSQSKGKKFSGLNKDELEGIVICETSDTPLAQQYDTLYDALIVYAGVRNPTVKQSIRTMKNFTKESFEPPMPDPSIYTDKEGKKDATIKKARMDRWHNECDIEYKRFMRYRETLRSLFSVVMGQLGTDIRHNMEGLEGWKIADANNDTIALLGILREQCYRDNDSKVHPTIDVIRKLKRLVLSKQNDPNKSAAEYAEETKQRGEVLKAAGVIIFSPQMAKYTLKKVMNDKYAYSEYLKMWGSDAPADISAKEEIEDAMRQEFISKILVEGL